MDLGYGNFGCAHYQRRCMIRAPCCGEMFSCRHCHNEAKNALEIDLKEQHLIPRHEVNRVICSLCGEEQDVQQNCSNCGVCFGNYFCEKCKLFDDNVSKNQFHCDGCGICRTGGVENFFHCDRCGCCYSKSLKDTHRCIEGAVHHNCPVCFEYLFDSVKDISVLPCGHTIHLDCLNEMSLLKIGLRHVQCVENARSGDCFDTHARSVSEQDGLDPMERLWGNIQYPFPHCGSQVPELQFLQYSTDKGCSYCMLEWVREKATVLDQ